MIIKRMIKNYCGSLLLILSLSILTTAASYAADSRNDVKAAQSSPPSIRGGIVFKNYCILCHGQRGDGNARSTKLYGLANLRIKPASSEYYANIIRLGGEKLGKSEFMPPWQNELTEEQINDVVGYLSVVSNPVYRGEVVYKTNCILCHGVNADGKGRVSKLYNPAPANLTISNTDENYRRKIIVNGGKAVGRSDGMPNWGEQISADEIEDVIVYLRSIMKK